MTGVEERPSGQTPGDPTPPSDPAREVFRLAMENYEELVINVGIVEFTMAGMKPGLRTGYLFNVLTGNFTPEQMQEDPRFAKLSEGAAVAIAQSHDFIPLRIANVTPSHAAEIRRRYEGDGVTLEIQPVRTPEVAFAWGSSGEEARDVLIGGLRPADDIIQAAAEIAAGIGDDFGEDHASVEEKFGFDILDSIKDKRASAILKYIALARNARMRGHAPARKFGLFFEPSKVLEEIVANENDKQSVSSITELDVRAAIESGALATDFSEIAFSQTA